MGSVGNTNWAEGFEHYVAKHVVDERAAAGAATSKLLDNIQRAAMIGSFIPGIGTTARLVAAGIAVGADAARGLAEWHKGVKLGEIARATPRPGTEMVDRARADEMRAQGVTRMVKAAVDAALLFGPHVVSAVWNRLRIGIMQRLDALRTRFGARINSSAKLEQQVAKIEEALKDPNGVERANQQLQNLEHELTIPPEKTLPDGVPPENKPLQSLPPENRSVQPPEGSVQPPKELPSGGERVQLYDEFGRPVLVRDGQIVEPAAAPVRIFDAAGRPIEIQGGQVVPTPPKEGPVALLQGPLEDPRPLVIQNGKEWSNPRWDTPLPSQFGPPILRRGRTLESRLLNAEGQSVTGIVQPPLPGLVTPAGTPIPRTGPVIVDLQSGTGMWLRNTVAETPGATGIGMESGSWMLTYRGIYPTPGAEFADQMARALRHGIVPNDPVWAIPGIRQPAPLPWERNPGPFFFPESGPVNIVQQDFFPAIGPGGRLPRNPREVVGIQPTAVPELYGRADQIYLRRTFALAKADEQTTVAMGQELNKMLKPRGFVEIRPTGVTDFSPDQIPIVAKQIPGSRVVRVEKADILEFRRTGKYPPNSTAEQQEIIRSAADDVGGLGPGEFRWVVRIYKE